MVGIMTAKQPLAFGVPTHNFYHGICLNYTYFHDRKNPHIGVHVVSDRDKVVLHFFLDGQYTHSEKLRDDVYYPAITGGGAGDRVSFVRPTTIPLIPAPSKMIWPVHPFVDYAY